MNEIGVAIGIMTALAAVLAAVLAVADRYLSVEEDPRLETTTEMLPGTNCGACGSPGCAAFAESLVAGENSPAGCTVADDDSRAQIATFLGVDVGSAIKRVARLKCAGGDGNARQISSYEGIKTCRAAIVVDGGTRSCTWGCLGLGDCGVVCDFDAIHMNRVGLPVVDLDLCTACGDCVDVCPLDLYVVAPIEEHLFVQCNTPLAGEAAAKACSVACDACGLCAADAPPGAVEMVGGLPVVNHENGPTARSTWRCPSGAIQWLTGPQFTEFEDKEPKRRNHA